MSLLHHVPLQEVNKRWVISGSTVSGTDRREMTSVCLMRTFYSKWPLKVQHYHRMMIVQTQRERKYAQAKVHSNACWVSICRLIETKAISTQNWPHARLWRQLCPEEGSVFIHLQHVLSFSLDSLDYIYKRNRCTRCICLSILQSIITIHHLSSAGRHAAYFCLVLYLIQTTWNDLAFGFYGIVNSSTRKKEKSICPWK